MDEGRRYLGAVGRRWRWTIFWAIVSGLAWQAAAISTPLLIRHAIDAGVVHHQARALWHDELVAQGERYARLWASWQAGLAG